MIGGVRASAIQDQVFSLRGPAHSKILLVVGVQRLAPWQLGLFRDGDSARRGQVRSCNMHRDPRNSSKDLDGKAPSQRGLEEFRASAGAVGRGR